MKKVLLFLLLITSSSILFSQTAKKNSSKSSTGKRNISAFVGIYEFELSSEKNYRILVFADGTTLGTESRKHIESRDLDKPYNFSNEKPGDKGTWKIISNNVFVMYWSDIPKWTCQVKLNAKGNIIGFIEDSGTFVQRISSDPWNSSKTIK